MSKNSLKNIGRSKIGREYIPPFHGMYMDNSRLKKSVEIAGEEYAIRYDYSIAKEIINVSNSPEYADLSDGEKAYMILSAFYVDYDQLPQKHYQEAIDKCMDFIACGIPRPKGKAPRLVDWEQDWPLIVGAINRILGYDIRSIPYDPKTNTGGVSWETCMSAYIEIGDCLLAQIVSMRDKLARGKKLEKHEREWYRHNKELVDFKTKYTQAEEEFLRQWI